MMMAQRALVRRDLHREGPHKLVCDDQMVPRLLVNRDRLLARIWLPGQGYCFTGLNWISTRRMSCAPVLVVVAPAGCGAWKRRSYAPWLTSCAGLPGSA